MLGSSRALKAEPSYLQQLTGLTGFNAAAANGKTEDGFAYANLFHDRWPDAQIKYLWILEAEAFRAAAAEPAAAGRARAGAALPGVAARRHRGSTTSSGCSSGSTTKSSVKSVWRAARGAPQEGAVVELAPDGFRTVDQHDRSEAAGVSFDARLAESVATARSVRTGDAADGPRARGAGLLRAGRRRHEPCRHGAGDRARSGASARIARPWAAPPTTGSTTS